MHDHQDVPFGWRVFCILLIVTPTIFLVLSWLVGETSTTKVLFPFTVIAIGWVLLWGHKRRSIALHGIVGFLLVYQTFLLVSLPEVESIGVVWFTAVPALVALLGDRNHIFIWTPITLVCVVICWAVYSKFAFMAHPLSLPNLIGCTLFISAAAYAIVADRDRRESSLRSTINLVRAEVAERQQAEKEATAARNAMSTFLASLSHEVRNPLTSIVLSADFLSLTVDEQESFESVQTIQQSAESLMLVVDDVMELAKSDVGAIQVQREPFHLEVLFDTVLRTVGPMFQDRDVRLFAGVMPDMPATWVGDERRIRQVIVNLVSNALTYSRGSAIWVRAFREGIGLRFEVGDNGCGISEQDQARIFQPFQRLEHSHAEAPRGAGLGLSISRGYARAMGGDLTVRSELGIGSVFQFNVISHFDDDSTIQRNHDLELPRETRIHVRDAMPAASEWASAWLQCWGATEDENAAPFLLVEHLENTFGCVSELRAAVEESYGSGRTERNTWSPEQSTRSKSQNDQQGRILICDDEAVVRKSVARILKLHGFEIIDCESGKQAIELIGTTRPNVVFLDVQLADENGVDVLKQIRQFDQVIPVCMLSGSMHHQSEATDAGANDYLLKPPSSSTLLAAIRNLIPEGSEHQDCPDAPE